MIRFWGIGVAAVWLGAFARPIAANVPPPDDAASSTADASADASAEDEAEAYSRLLEETEELLQVAEDDDAAHVPVLEEVRALISVAEEFSAEEDWATATSLLAEAQELLRHPNAND